MNSQRAARRHPDPPPLAAEGDAAAGDGGVIPSPVGGGGRGGGRSPTLDGSAVATSVDEAPLLEVEGLSKSYGTIRAVREVSFRLWPGEVLGVVGESGSGKTTLLNCLAGQLPPDAGTVRYALRDGRMADIFALSEPERRLLARTEWGFVHQNPRDGLRLRVSAGANIGERLMMVGARHYGNIRGAAIDWLERVEIERDRLDDTPTAFSGGMQQRLQIARNLVSGPRLVFMDEPTGSLDVSVQARLLDLLRRLVADLGLSAVIVTHDLGVARLLAHRLMVMRRGEVIEAGLTDQVLDDPQHPYTQLLAASVLQA
jgi:putative phosphonate transport system ATP-binding protein